MTSPDLETQNKLHKLERLRLSKDENADEWIKLDREIKRLESEKKSVMDNIMKIHYEEQQIHEWLSEREAESLASGSKIINPEN